MGRKTFRRKNALRFQWLRLRWGLNRWALPKPRFKRQKPAKVVHDVPHGEGKPTNTGELTEVMAEELAKPTVCHRRMKRHRFWVVALVPSSAAAAAPR